jgi:hypothetical protein
MTVGQDATGMGAGIAYVAQGDEGIHTPSCQ